MGYPIEERLKNVEQTVQDLSAAAYIGHPEQDTTFQGVVTDVFTADDCSGSYLVVNPFDAATPDADGNLTFLHVNGNPMDRTASSQRVVKVFVVNVPNELYGVYYKLGDVIEYRRYTGVTADAAKIVGSYVTRKDGDLGFWAHVKPATLADSPCNNLYTFTACRYDINGATQKDKFPVYTLCSGATFTGQCRNLSQLLGTTQAAPTWLIAEQVLKVYPFPNPVKGGTPTFAYYFNYTANQVMRGLVDQTPDSCATSVVVRSCADSPYVNPDNPGTTTTLGLPHNTGDSTFVGLNATAGTSVLFLTTGPHAGVLLNPYKSFDVKYANTTGTPEVPDCESIRFDNNDFDIAPVTFSPCDVPTAAKINWAGLTAEATDWFTGTTTQCNVKVLNFNTVDEPVHIGKSKYPVEFAISADTEHDPCNGSGETLKRGRVHGSVWVRDLPPTTTVDVVVGPITADCNPDGTITINYSTKTITVIDTSGL